MSYLPLSPGSIIVQQHVKEISVEELRWPVHGKVLRICSEVMESFSRQKSLDHVTYRNLNSQAGEA